jgi:hypothetical protein
MHVRVASDRGFLTLTALIAVTLTLLASQVWVRSHPGSTRDLPPSAVLAVMPRQLWVWHPGDPQALVALARRYEVTDLLVWVSPGFTADPEEFAYLADLRAHATAVGIHLDALGGDPSWADAPRTAAAWADEVHRSGLFDRLHLDIEPYALPDWATGRATLAEGLLAALAAARGADMPIDTDIPYWYSTIQTSNGEPLDVAVMRLTDSVTIMAYRNTTVAVLSVAAAEMAHAAVLGKPAWIGVNTASPGTDPASTSYYGQAAATIERDIAALDTEARRWPTFAGLALQDYESLAILK